MRTQSLGQTTGLLVSPSPRSRARRLDSLSSSAVRELFRSSGFLVFRDFNSDLTSFAAFVERFATAAIGDPGSSKTPIGSEAIPFIQGVRAAFGDEQDLHCENGATPDMPDLLWFYCVRPAAHGGLTKFCDGVRLWRSLRAETRRMFTRYPLLYEGYVSGADWTKPGATIDLSVEPGGADMSGFSYEFLDDGRIRTRKLRSAVQRLPWLDGTPAFVNSMFGPYGDLKARFADRPIPREIWAEVRALHRAQTETVGLLPGDFVGIDNHRFMHGRTAFADAHREIYSAMVMTDFLTLARGK